MFRTPAGLTIHRRCAHSKSARGISPIIMTVCVCMWYLHFCSRIEWFVFNTYLTDLRAYNTDTLQTNGHTDVRRTVWERAACMHTNTHSDTHTHHYGRWLRHRRRCWSPLARSVERSRISAALNILSHTHTHTHTSVQTHGHTYVVLELWA